MKYPKLLRFNRRYNHPALLLTLAVTIASPVGALYGQDEDEDDGEVYQLSPFVVDSSSDVGYRSTNSTSGTSLNTAIKDIPMAIEVINQDFLEDTGATNFEEALAYSAGVFTEDFSASDGVGKDGTNSPGVNSVDSADRSPSSRGGVGGRFDNVTIIRGFNVPFQNRDGFRYGGLIAQYGTVLGGIIDTSNVERMEIVRGPNSLLYGIGVLSGIVNVIPKKPLTALVQSASVGFGNVGYLRTTVDSTGPLSNDILGGTLAYRVAATYEERDHWTDFRGKELEYYVAQLQFQNEKWNVFLEGQYADQRELGIGDQHIHDNLNAAVNQNDRNEFGEQFNWTKKLGGLPESYRVTGPDTYHYRRETDFMANVEFTPIENFTISAGMFLTDADELERNVNISTVTNVEKAFDIKVLEQRTKDTNTENPQEILDWFETSVSRSPTDLDVPSGSPLSEDLRTVRYWWTDDPETTSTEQYRLRLTYRFETDFFGESKAEHNFLLGRHDIKDETDFTRSNEFVTWMFASKGELADNDALQTRAIDDHSVIRYNGEPLGVPSREYRNVEVWFTGHYGLYQGKFFDDKLSLIAGVRHDRYHSRDREYDRYQEEGSLNIKVAPSDIFWDNPQNETFGFYDLPIGVSEYIPNSTEAETETTKTIAVNYKIRDDLTIYAVRAEGLTPNTGARDGNLVGLPSEKSVSKEIGLKFELMESKLSGTLSLYNIERENALWEFSGAPAPAKWVGLPVDPVDETDELTGFDPKQVVDGGVPLNYGIDSFYFEEDGVDINKVTKFVDGRRVKEYPDGVLSKEGQRSDTTNPRNIVYLDYNKLDYPAIDSDGIETGKTWRYYMEKAFADKTRSASEFREAAGPDDFDPLFWDRTRGTTYGMNASLDNSSGANVTYTDEAKGFDLQLIYSVTDNWQMIINYAHTEREAKSSFNMVEAYDPVSQTHFGTEYDIWVHTFGREAFGLLEEDTDGDGVIDSITKDGKAIKMGDVLSSDLVGGLEGVSLYTGSEDSASLWSKYSFTEGIIKGLDASLGIKYTGPAQTSIPIGGDELAVNQFGTPETAERWKVDTSLKYKWVHKDISYTLKLNVLNLLDDQKGLSTISYLDDGVIVNRRTVNYYDPRSYRLSLSALF